MQAAYLILAERVRERGVCRVSRELGVHRSTVSRWISGEQNMTLNQAEDLARVVGARIRVELPEEKPA